MTSMRRMQRNLGLPKFDASRLPLPCRMKKRTSETLRALALLVFFMAGAVLGMLLACSQFEMWKDNHFSAGWHATSPDAYYSGFLVCIGFFVFVICAFCVFKLLRYDLGPKGKKMK